MCDFEKEGYKSETKSVKFLFLFFFCSFFKFWAILVSVFKGLLMFFFFYLLLPVVMNTWIPIVMYIHVGMLKQCRKSMLSFIYQLFHMLTVEHGYIFIYINQFYWDDFILPSSLCKRWCSCQVSIQPIKIQLLLSASLWQHHFWITCHTPDLDVSKCYCNDFSKTSQMLCHVFQV